MIKLEMAHDWAMKHGNELIYKTVEDAWKYADAMQAEAEKRKDKGIPDAILNNEKIQQEHRNYHDALVDVGLEDWQPDWSQAPNWAKWWATDEDGDAYWYDGSGSPWANNGVFESSCDGHTYDAPSFGYQGSWENSLRKKP